MSDEKSTIAYINVYRGTDGINFGLVADTLEQAASWVVICDGVPISTLKLTFDVDQPFGQRIVATEIRQ